MYQAFTKYGRLAKKVENWVHGQENPKPVRCIKRFTMATSDLLNISNPFVVILNYGYES